MVILWISASLFLILGVPEILLNATNPSMNNFLISFEMEKYIHFMLQFVHVAPHFPTRRYQEMFTVSPKRPFFP